MTNKEAIMDDFDRKKHWENIYRSKGMEEVSWFQPTPATSLDFVKQFKLPGTAKIIDIGGGDSFFVDHLLDMDYRDITVLDISKEAIKKAKHRLGDRAKRVKWIVADAVDFQPTEKYALWHDRAAFHFLTDEKEIESYLDTVRANINPTGYLVIGTFSEQGPKKCSGIDIKQYSERTMTDRLKHFFEKIKCISVDHKTPFDTIQNFIFCSFKRLGTA
ncbi:MAG: class I SAM-dependent methyltransferase [Cytophagales bacterium]|nr:class I SAM-dependent methyltransferase [Cytophagales bacterium]